MAINIKVGVTSQLLVVVAIILGVSRTEVFAAPALQDIFQGFLRNTELTAAHNDKAIEKRRIYEGNPDGALKQISLQSLINDFEDSLLQSALSVSSVASDQSAFVPEIRPAFQAPVNNQKKRGTDEKVLVAPTEGPQSLTPAVPSATAAPGIILQTTQKVVGDDKKPPHLIIDRITVEPHSNTLPLIPAFQVHHTKVISTTIKDNAPDGSDRATKISITQTSLKSNDNNNESSASKDDSSEHKPQQQKATIVISTQNLAPVTVAASSPEQAVAATAQTVSSTTTPKDSAAAAAASKEETATTTKEPIVKLKEAEEELKEKVAEIEAEPVILSARV